MEVNLHHAHLFARNIENSINFYREMFGAEVLFDLEMAGARNVMISIGTANLNFYDQPPKEDSRGVVHHLGIETEDLENLVAHMRSKGYQFRSKIKSLGVWKYIMAEGPDHILLELFEIVRDKVPEEQYSRITSLNILKEV